MAYNQTVYPYDTVVYITDTIGNEDFQGSGVLVAPDEVLTATHVVYDSAVGTATNIQVTPAYGAGSAPDGSATGTFFEYNSIDDGDGTISNSDSQYDFAVIKLSQAFNVGTMSLGASYAGGQVHVTGYPAVQNGTQTDSVQSVSVDANYSLLVGTSLGDGSSGGPVWVATSNGAQVVGLVSTATGGPGSTGYDVQLTAADDALIDGWIAQNESSSSNGLAVVDTSTGQTVAAAASAYNGPVAGLQEQFIDITPDNLNVSVTTDNWFLHTGAGTDAITVLGGTSGSAGSVLDGGTGSNFLTGGNGNDTFFVDDRSATSDIWSTMNNFHDGDSATVWGVTPGAFSFDWVNGQGAAGYTGLTLHAEQSGYPTASLTLSGYTSSALSNGSLLVEYGTDAASGSPYMFIHANG